VCVCVCEGGRSPLPLRLALFRHFQLEGVVSVATDFNFKPIFGGRRETEGGGGGSQGCFPGNTWRTDCSDAIVRGLRVYPILSNTLRMTCEWRRAAGFHIHKAAHGLRKKLS